MLKDMFGREIQKGDLVIFVNPVTRPVQIVDIEEPSMLGDPRKGAVGKISCMVAWDAPFMNPNRSPNTQLSDVIIVQKFKDVDVPPGTPTQ